MADNKDVKPHFFLGSIGRAQSYTSPATGGGRKPAIPAQNRQKHGAALIHQLGELAQQQVALQVEAHEQGLESTLGIQVEFESFPEVELAVESLADARQKIELLNVIHRDDKVLATVFVPEGKLTAIESKLQAYLEERKSSRPGRARADCYLPCHGLVANKSRTAALRQRSEICFGCIYSGSRC